MAAQARKTVLGRALDHWIVKSLLCGAVGSVCDYALLFSLVKGAGFPVALAAPIGVATGASVSFLVNRTFAFKDSDAAFAGAAVRYLAGFSLLVTLHAMVVSSLVARFSVPLFFAKVGADLSILAGGQLLLLRYVVFPRNKGRPAIATERPLRA